MLSGWTQTKVDRCLFCLYDDQTHELIALAGIHVDDFLICGVEHHKKYQQAKQEDDILVPAVFNKDALFMGEDVLLELKGKGKVKNAAYFLDEYTQQLQNLLREIFDPEDNFDQTEDLRKCTLCAYKEICGR